jgi:hypothetical protein
MNNKPAVKPAVHPAILRAAWKRIKRPSWRTMMVLNTMAKGVRLHA